MKVLLLGKGLLGREIEAVLKENSKFECYACGHDECDITDLPKVAKIIQKFEPEIIVNATGYTNVDKAEQEKEKAFQINGHAVGNLAKFCVDRKLPIMHFSTDYVFGGHNRDGYREGDPPHPINEYGKSKAHGEHLLMQNTPYYFLIRSQWLYGHSGKNFVDTMLELSQKPEPLRVVNDQFGKPTWARDLARALTPLFGSENFGIYHIVNEGVTSWFEFAKEIFKIRGIEKDVIPITSEELGRSAFRPKFSSLTNTKLPHLRNWKNALTKYLQVVPVHTTSQ